MDELLKQEELLFTPTSGSFDVEQVAAAILPLGHALRDATVPSVFLIFMDADSREACRAARAADPKAPLPYVLLIDVKSERIAVNQFAGPEFAPWSRQFIEWLGSHYDCRVTNEDGEDLSAALRP